MFWASEEGKAGADMEECQEAPLGPRGGRPGALRSDGLPCPLHLPTLSSVHSLLYHLDWHNNLLTGPPASTPPSSTLPVYSPYTQKAPFKKANLLISLSCLKSAQASPSLQGGILTTAWKIWPLPTSPKPFSSPNPPLPPDPSHR